MIGLIERIRDCARLHRRWGFTWKQAWRMTSPSFTVRLGGAQK